MDGVSSLGHRPPAWRFTPRQLDAHDHTEALVDLDVLATGPAGHDVRHPTTLDCHVSVAG